MNVSLLPKQLEFLQAQDRELLYSGAFGAGKSRCLAVKLLTRAVIPGAREGLCRKHLVTLKATTLKTLLDADGDLPPVLPQGTYAHNKSEKVIRIIGGGEIQYFGLDDPGKIGSYNLSGVAIDQAEELTQDDWTQLLGRIRANSNAMPNQIYAACNPDTPSHFLALRFGLAGGTQASPGCRAIQTQTADNWFLSAEYLASLNAFIGTARERFVLGRWVGSDRMVYANWDRRVFVRQREGPWKRVIVGCDSGYTNPAVHLLICEDGDGRLHVAEEWYRAGQLNGEVVAHARSWHSTYGVEYFVVDPSAAELIAEMKGAGMPTLDANNAVREGLLAVQSYLQVVGDGRPWLTVDPRCENTIREFESYERKPGSEDPVKSYDHAMDALRYAVRYAVGANTPFCFNIVGLPSAAAARQTNTAAAAAAMNERQWNSYNLQGETSWR